MTALQTRTKPPRQYAAHVAPTGRERTFAEHELIVTKTDTRGVITYANAVFLRVAAMTEQEALGAPHSVIRHPDMPRCVFQFLWDRISGGDEIFAYVINLAADGDHYWVLAHVTPSFGPDGAITGYHSNRRVPDRRAVDAAAGLYAKLKEVEDAQPSKSEAIAAGTAMLTAFLNEKKLSYDELVFAL